MTRPRFDLDDEKPGGDGVAATTVPRFAPDRERLARGSGPPVSTLAIGMAVLLGSLTMLFVGFIGAYIVLKFSAPAWPPPGTPEMPAGLWGSTALLVLCSAALHRGLAGVRRGDDRALRRGIALATAFGLAFLALQAYSWAGLFSAGMTLQSDLYGAMFYTLTGAHAAHVLGGIAILLTVLARAFGGRYSSASYGGVGACAAYWHFLGAVWIVIFLLLVVFP